LSSGDDVTVRRLVDAVREGRLEAVRSMVASRPELVHLDLAENDEHRALHHAVPQRDDLLRSTPLGWACRWGRVEMATLLLDRGADPIEADADAWASPIAWARKKDHRDIAALLDAFRTRS
jgi:ankyrin repeat protein